MFTYRVDDEISLALYDEHQAETVYALMDKNRARLREYFAWMDNYKSADDWRTFVQSAKKDFADGKRLPLTIMYHGEIVGDIMLTLTASYYFEGELSYWLDVDHSGNGIVTRAVRAIVDYAFGYRDYNRIVIRCAPQNTASCAVAERLGFVHEGVLRQDECIGETYNDLNLYAMLKQDWHISHQNQVFDYRVDTHITLQLFELHHAEALFALTEANRAHIERWLPGIVNNRTVEDTRDFVKRSLEQYTQNKGFQAGIFYDDQLVGAIGFVYWDFRNMKTEIGYWLSKAHTGHGIITKATQAMVTYAFDVLGFNRIAISCSVGNDKSCAIAERLGFHLDGVAREMNLIQGEFVDLNQFSLLKSEWQAKHNV